MLFSHKTRRLPSSLVIYGLHNNSFYELHVVKSLSLYALKMVGISTDYDKIEVETIIFNKILFHFDEEYFCNLCNNKKIITFVLPK